LLAKIEEALERVEDGSFGVCEACGEEIGIKRLEARPVTTLCIDCKTLQETKEKAQGQ
jgi:DnaK suppressor protein